LTETEFVWLSREQVSYKSNYQVEVVNVKKWERKRRDEAAVEVKQVDKAALTYAKVFPRWPVTN